MAFETDRIQQRGWVISVRYLGRRLVSLRPRESTTSNDWTRSADGQNERKLCEGEISARSSSDDHRPAIPNGLGRGRVFVKTPNSCLCTSLPHSSTSYFVYTIWCFLTSNGTLEVELHVSGAACHLLALTPLSGAHTHAHTQGGHLLPDAGPHETAWRCCRPCACGRA